MISIRKNCFETNSSSTHAMVVAHEEPKYYPSHIHFDLGEFGWEFNVLQTTREKAAYLYTSICCMLNNKEKLEEAKNQLSANLAINGVTCDFQEPIYKHYDFENSEGFDWLENGNIDHYGTDEHYEWVNEMLTNPDALNRFLFTSTSHVVTGNDNCTDEEYEWELGYTNPSYKHTTYYKGN